MEEIFIDGMVEAIEKAAPGNVFNAVKSDRKRRKKKIKRIIPKMLRTIWLNSSEFQITTPSVPSVRTPVINWSQVNRRAMDNLPKLQAYPVHGCSQDPEFYKEHMKTEFEQNKVVPPKHSGDFPFGYKHGYLTQYGVVSVGILPAPVHGYTYDQEEKGWVLHARYPEEIKRDREKDFKKNQQSFKYRRKRQVEMH